MVRVRVRVGARVSTCYAQAMLLGPAHRARLGGVLGGPALGGRLRLPPLAPGLAATHQAVPRRPLAAALGVPRLTSIAIAAAAAVAVGIPELRLGHVKVEAMGRRVGRPGRGARRRGQHRRELDRLPRRLVVRVAGRALPVPNRLQARCGRPGATRAAEWPRRAGAWGAACGVLWRWKRAAPGAPAGRRAGAGHLPTCGPCGGPMKAGISSCSDIMELTREGVSSRSAAAWPW